MKKLLLTSAGFLNPKIGDEFLKLLSKNPKDIKVLFIPTASEYKLENGPAFAQDSGEAKEKCFT